MTALAVVALDQLVAAIAGLGLAVTRDPGDAQPPCVLVGLPDYGAGGTSTLLSIALAVPVQIIGDGPGQPAGDWMLDATERVLREFGETDATRTTWVGPINPNGLPAYLVTVHMNAAPGG